jgi:polar amino acid transport system substrate-binding protein
MKNAKIFKRVSAACLLFISTLSLSAIAGASQHCTVMTASGNAEYPPYLWRSPDNPQHLVGAIAYMIDDLSKEIGVKIDLLYKGPWGRVQTLVSKGRVDITAGAFYTKPREDYMDYLYPEFQGTATSVWYNLNTPFEYDMWSDLKSLRGVTVINNSFGQEFDEYSANELEIKQVASLEQGLKMLSASRVDYLIYEKNPGMAYAKQIDVPDLDTHKIPITRQNLYLTVSKASKCNTPELKADIEEALVLFNTQNRMASYLQQAHKLWAEQQK